jgi:hypothetical protein
MNMFGMRWEEIFALLLIAMGPVGISMSYIPCNGYLAHPFKKWPLGLSPPASFWWSSGA